MTNSLFNLPPRSTKAGDLALAQKLKTAGQKKAGVSIKGGGGLSERIATITAMVNKYLGQYADKYATITDEAELAAYIDSCIENGVVSVDTETTSLDPMLCTIAGVCLYTPGQKAVYVPVHHVSYITGVEVSNQLSAEYIQEQLQRLVDAKVQVIMFNAKFDMRVLNNQLGVKMIATWDGYIASRLLNENEPEANLKYLHRKYCEPTENQVFKYDDLFKGIPFTHIPVKVGYLYAARDAEITYELYQFQKPFLTADSEECISRDLQGPAWVFHNIEMPLVPIVAEMEDTGIAFDFEYAQKLSEKYNQKLKAELETNYEIGSTFGDKLDAYRQKMGPNNKLERPVNIASPTQVAIMLYDILEVGVVDKEKPRGTGEDVLQKIDHPIAKSILRYRETAKLLSTYVDKMPTIVNPNTGRIHASFNQMGADTGRFSSSDPNMQNIPSHNKDIRKMFKATDGYVLMSSDYSAQEPRLTAHMSRDTKMIEAYRQGKDLYVEIASLAFDLPYDECKEYRADGTQNPEGKKRRNTAKAIVLGVCYGKGVPAIADDLNITVKKAQEIYNKIMKGFPGLEQFMKDSEDMARELGYVTTVWGRKRRLPSMQLPPYEFGRIDGGSHNFDPLAFDEDLVSDEDLELSPAEVEKWTRMLNRCKSRGEKQSVINTASKQGIYIKDNGGYIAEATRQCVNSRVQGSAADQTKLAMILTGTDARLKELGFRLLLPVHDELIAECPKENAAEVVERFSALMVEAAKDLDVPSKCDVEVTKCWYGEPLKY